MLKYAKSVSFMKKPRTILFSTTCNSVLGDNWLGVQLDQFTKCESNLATNRQTRMLSDLALVGCYNRTSLPPHERDRIMLASAKRNLATMAYFGLTEFQKVIFRAFLIP